MGRIPFGSLAGKTVLSLAALLALSFVSATFAACEAEAQAVAEAEQDVTDAEEAYDLAYDNFLMNPNPATAQALAEAEQDLEEALAALQLAQDELSECFANNPPVCPVPFPLELAEVNEVGAESLYGESVLITCSGK